MPRLARVTPRLPVTNLHDTLDFYRRRLGFAVDVLWPDPNPTFAVLLRDGVELGFFVPNEHQPGPIGYAELYIQTDDAAALHNALSGDVSIEWGPEVFAYGRREFAVRDPNGYLVIFTEPTDDLPTTSEPGDASDGDSR